MSFKNRSSNVVALFPKSDPWQEVHDQAHEAGLSQADRLQVQTWGIEGYEDVAFEPIGFANVRVRPANAPFARWAVAEGIAMVDTGSPGVVIYPPGDRWRQSHARRMEYCNAYAYVLHLRGLQATVEGRLD